MKHSPAVAPLEVEIKFRLPSDDSAALEMHPALQGTECETQHHVTTYFDTPDRVLAKQGISLRVRRHGRRHIQTLKLPSAERGAFAREEWEWPVTSNRPELDVLSETPLAPRLPELRSLQAAFVTDVWRSVRKLQQDGAMIELSLDHGRIRAGTATEPVHELELELKEGPPAPLYRLAAALHATGPLSLGTESKADRGWRLCTGHARGAVKEGVIALPDRVAAGEAFNRITGAALAHLLANEPAAEAGDMEGVHQMRVAIRRLRAALVLFRPLLERHAEARFTAELRRLGRVFGEARDWDVFCTETLAQAEQGGVATPWLDLLRDPAERERAAAHAGVAAELRGPALTALVIGLAEWAGDAAALAGDMSGCVMQAKLADCATDLTGRLAQKVRRPGRHIARRSDEELHTLRKTLKKLRYSIEFLAPLGRHKRVKAYLHGCKALQKQLGAMNDARVAVALAERLGGDRRAELAPALAALAGWAAARQAVARQRLRDEWRAFKPRALPV